MAMSDVALRPARRLIERLSGSPPLVLLSIAWIVVLLVLAVAAPLLAPHGYADQQPLLRLKPPSLLGFDSPFLLGSDHLGRDILSRTIYAVRFSVMVALLATFIGAILGVASGMVAARLRGWWDETIMMVVDMQASLPFIIFAITIVGFFGKSLPLLILVIGFAGWDRYARLTRGLVLDAETRGYADALRALGATTPRIYLQHILPNIAGALLVQMTLNFPETVILETGLSFLGMGVQPPLTSLGLMVNDSRNYIVNACWMAAVPSGVIVLTTISTSIFGDWLRDRLTGES
ncbi:MAG TPA: ABC transporter permease [Devosiaceae bacterium]|jgi:peptide/nickel transport system permease protein